MTEDIDGALARSSLRLAFTPSLEERFEASTGPARMAFTRHFLVLSLVADVCALGLDQAHGAFEFGVALRLGIVAPVLVAAICLLSVRRRTWQQGAIVIVPIFLGLTSIALIGLLMGGHFAELYLSASGMVGFLVNAILPLRFRHACILTLATIAATTFMVFTVPGTGDPSALVGTLAFNAIVMVLTLTLNYRQERNARTAFLYECRSETQTKALVEANRKLERMSRTDPLTDLPNRRVFQEALDRSRAQARRTGGVFGLLMIDIDRFKLLNDALGHSEGDRCLRAVADAIRAETRDDFDTVARFGGEEFAVVLPEADHRVIRLVGERIRAAVVKRGIPHPGLSVNGSVTISLGGAVSSGADGWDDRLLITRADAALYAAKGQGRNRVVIQGDRDQTGTPMEASVRTEDARSAFEGA